MKEVNYVGQHPTIDLDNWHTMSPKGIRQARARQVHFGRIACPKCGERLVIPLDFFKIKLNGTIVSEKPLKCAEDSKNHGYHGGCGHEFTVKKDRPIRGMTSS